MKPEPPRVLTVDEIESRLGEIEKCAQLAGHRPNADALDRARRILTGEISLDEARSEILAKYTDAGRD